ncbi:tRNA (adenine-N(1)-)-methyltransferase catalytic subunit trm61 [Borealophlyctis nickersoniae]|nr:tRNA (adenine-N(1)-)-methyltransferase catalytic subunit trm61 [Borealophlyctis nickersoniae]
METQKTTATEKTQSAEVLRPTFKQYTERIQYGDTVILFMSPTNMQPTVIKVGGTFNNAYGLYRHADMVGKEWGSKLASTNGKGFIYLMYPSPELWTLSLPHRTQILYLPDIALVSSFLDLRPGVKMIECGTGSGSFSHSIARSIAPTGHLYTFEYSEHRYNLASVEFQNHGLADVITIRHRDVCKDGFDMEDAVTAVFLDLPAPWEAIASAKRALRKDRVGRLCSFSPCMEQVQKTCVTLKEQGFVEIRMYEVLVKPYDIRKHYIRDLPLQIPARQTRQNRAADTAAYSAPPAGAGDAPPYTGDSAISDEVNASKKRKLEDGTTVSVNGGTGTATGPTSEASTTGPNSHQTMIISRGTKEMRGHTSYLTFATLLPTLPE